MDALNEISCNYIQFVDDGFYCLEKFSKSKKKDPLGLEPKEVIILCSSCIQGKRDSVEAKINEERRKESMKKILDFAKQFMVITEKGFLATSYMCIANTLDGELTFSRDGKSLTCTLQDNDIVSIPDICMCALNPKTQKPPCQYLVTMEHLASITKDDLKKMNLDLPTLEYEEPYIDYDKLNPKTNKNVDAKYEVKEE